MLTITLADDCEFRLDIIHFDAREEGVDYLEAFGFSVAGNCISTAFQEIVKSELMDSLSLRDGDDVDIEIVEILFGKQLKRDYNE
ncbi:hypothetical protein HDU87_006942 [Geranomyces variabilis]|uniref:Uncharacterized protein n=1 Tax=Geranomyces variabilis TaxID=109894 RepID=A0AAD5XNM3_9FUNG|nr:hypothetical protein HDU87_006942 [Geranomyces variabilis]